MYGVHHPPPSLIILASRSPSLPFPFLPSPRTNERTAFRRAKGRRRRGGSQRGGRERERGGIPLLGSEAEPSFSSSFLRAKHYCCVCPRRWHVRTQERRGLLPFLELPFFRPGKYLSWAARGEVGPEVVREGPLGGAVRTRPAPQRQCEQTYVCFPSSPVSKGTVIFLRTEMKVREKKSFPGGLLFKQTRGGGGNGDGTGWRKK